MNADHEEPVRWQFSLRQLLVLTAATALLLVASAALPTGVGSIGLLVATLILPGVLATIAAVGGKQAKTFCWSALVPIAFSLYAVGWAFGWVIFQSSDALQLVGWFETYGTALKAVILSAWLCGGLAGTVCLVLRRILERKHIEQAAAKCVT